MVEERAYPPGFVPLREMELTLVSGAFFRDSISQSFMTSSASPHWNVRNVGLNGMARAQNRKGNIRDKSQRAGQLKYET